MSRLFTASLVLLALGAGSAFAQDPSGNAPSGTTTTSGKSKPAAAGEGASNAPENAAQAKGKEVGMTSTDAAAPQATAGPMVAVLTTGQGTIVIKFYEKEAPQTVANFKKLVKSKFYDGTCFHRVIRGFMIQGGDPNSKDADPSNDGQGGPGYTVPAEIKLKHVRGAVATARQGDAVNPSRASSGSQFFIDVADLPSLDAGGYTVFGKVISGMDAVDKIVAFSDDATLPSAGGGGKNPGKKALIVKATLEPLSKWEKPAAPGQNP